MYVGPVGGNVVQFAVTVDPFDGTSKYQFRTYVTGLSILTGLGIAGDLQSLMIYTDPTTLGLASQEVVTKLPLCEDMLGEQTVASGGGTTTIGGGTTTGTTGTTGTAGTTTSTANSTIPALGFTTPLATAAAATTPITGGIVGGIAAPASTGTPATTAGGVGGVGGTSNGAGANSPSAAKGGASTAGAATNPAAGATISGTPVPTGTPGLFAAAGQDPSGPMTAKVTLVSRAGMPRIAFDSAPAPIPSFVASRSTTPTLPDETASIGPSTASPGKNLTSNTRTKSRASTGVRPNGKLASAAAGPNR
jgi:hypothetical protein